MKEIAESQSQNSVLIKSIKIKAFVFITLSVIWQIFALLSFANRGNNVILSISSIVMPIISFISLIILTISLQKVSKSKNLLQNLLIATIIAPLVFCFVFSMVRTFGLGHIPRLICFGAFLLIFISYTYLYFRELAFITNQKLFIIAFWCAIVLNLLVIFALVANDNIGGYFNLSELLFLLLPSFIMYIIAWIKLKEIRLSQMGATKMPKIKIETFLIATIIVLLLVFVVLLLNYM